MFTRYWSWEQGKEKRSIASVEFVEVEVMAVAVGMEEVLGVLGFTFW